MSSSLKKQAVSGVFWTFAQQFSVQIINFVVQIILARLLMPEMFGLIAMLSVFIAIGQTLMDSGMTSSLIRTKDPDQLDYSTVFMTNMLISVAVYLLVFLIASNIAAFYNQSILKDILRVYALSFVIRSFVAVHVAKLTKEMKFKTQMKLQIPSTIIAAIVGVTMAYKGFGVWSLVWLNLTQTIIFTIQSWIFIPWKPSLKFDKEKFRHHFNFGYKMTLSSLIDTIYKNIYNIIIGKFFSPTIAGFYNQADHIRKLPVTQMASVLEKVTYPFFSNISKREQLKSAYKKVMRLSFFISVPLMMYLIVVAKDLFFVLFGEKWLPAVPYFQILAVASIIRPLHSYNLNILKVNNKSELFLKLEVLKKIIGIIAIVISMPFGITALVYSYTIAYYVMIIPSMHYSGREISYKMKEQLTDCLKIFLIGFFSAIAIYFVNRYLEYLNVIPILSLFILGLLYSFIYILLILFFEKEIILIIKSIIIDFQKN
jgi:O-antigen/teichoic acid export membrane protein